MCQTLGPIQATHAFHNVHEKYAKTTMHSSNYDDEYDDDLSNESHRGLQRFNPSISSSNDEEEESTVSDSDGDHCNTSDLDVETNFAVPQEHEDFRCAVYECSTDKPMMEVEAGSNIWFQAHIMQESKNELRVLFPAPTDGDEDVESWVKKTSSRIWRGSLKGKDWKYLGKGAWEPRASVRPARNRKAKGKKRKVIKKNGSVHDDTATATATGTGTSEGMNGSGRLEDDVASPMAKKQRVESERPHAQVAKQHAETVKQEEHAEVSSCSREDDALEHHDKFHNGHAAAAPPQVQYEPLAEWFKVHFVMLQQAGVLNACTTFDTAESGFIAPAQQHPSPRLVVKHEHACPLPPVKVKQDPAGETSYPRASVDDLQAELLSDRKRSHEETSCKDIMSDSDRSPQPRSQRGRSSCLRELQGLAPWGWERVKQADAQDDEDVEDREGDGDSDTESDEDDQPCPVRRRSRTSCPRSLSDEQHGNVSSSNSELPFESAVPHKMRSHGRKRRTLVDGRIQLQSMPSGVLPSHPNERSGHGQTAGTTGTDAHNNQRVSAHTTEALAAKTSRSRTASVAVEERDDLGTCNSLMQDVGNATDMHSNGPLKSKGSKNRSGPMHNLSTQHTREVGARTTAVETHNPPQRKECFSALAVAPKRAVTHRTTTGHAEAIPRAVQGPVLLHKASSRPVKSSSTTTSHPLKKPIQAQPPPPLTKNGKLNSKPHLPASARPVVREPHNHLSSNNNRHKIGRQQGNPKL